MKAKFKCPISNLPLQNQTNLLFYIFSDKKFLKRKKNVCSVSERRPDGPKSDQVGRMPLITLNTKSSELFHLRLLLHNVPGPTCFEDLRTVDGQLCQTFQEATVKLGLWEDDTECYLALEEAFSIQFGQAFIQCFVSIILNCMPSNPRELYEHFKDKLADHLTHHHKLAEATEEIHNSVLIEIKNRLENSGQKMEDYGLPLPIEEEVFETEPRILQEEIDYCDPTMHDQAIADRDKLNEEQRIFFDHVIDSVTGGKGGVMVIDAPGGTGKTFVLMAIINYLRSLGLIVIVTAMSSIASILLPGGRTLHFKAAVPIKLHDKSMCKIKENTAHARLMQEASLLIIDEKTMGQREVFETVDRSLRLIRKCENQPFGGLPVVMSGDWRQTLPVTPGGSKADIIANSLKASKIWTDHAEKFSLENNMRLVNSTQEVIDYANFIMRIGNGQEKTYPQMGEDMVLIPKNIKSTATNIKEFCEEIFPDLKNIVKEGLKNEGIEGHDEWKTWLMERYIICGTNEDCLEINDLLMKELDGQAMIYHSADKVLESVDSDGRDTNNEARFPTEYLNTLRSSSMPPHILILKPGCPIKLMRNLDPANGHCNGSRYVVKALSKKIITAELAVGPHKGNILHIPRIVFQPDDRNIPVEFQRRQFPVRPSFAITSNACQGQTSKMNGLYLKNDLFAHGQLYVALSRVGHPNRIKVFKPVAEPQPKDKKDKKNKTPDDSHLFMKNVVYKEILS